MACETRRLDAFCVPETQGGRTGCSSPFRRLPKATKKEEVLRSHKTSSLVRWKGLSRTLTDSPQDCPPRPGRKAAGRAVRVPSRGSRKQQKKKRFLVSLEPLLWCAGRDSPAPLRTVRRTVRPGRDARRPDGLFESLPEAPESNKKRKGSLFPWNLFFGALEGTLPRPCGQSAGLSAPAGTQGGRTGCSSPFRRLPETTKKKRFLVSLEPLLWCAGRDSNPRPSDS